MSALFCVNERRERRGYADRRTAVIGCDHRIAHAAQPAEIVERDEDQLLTARVVALAEQRHARGEMERLRPCCDVIVRGTNLVVRLARVRCCPESSIADIAHLSRNAVARFQVAYKPHVTIWEERAARTRRSSGPSTSRSGRRPSFRRGGARSLRVRGRTSASCACPSRRMSTPPRGEPQGFILARGHEDPALERSSSGTTASSSSRSSATAGGVAERLDTGGD